MKTTINENQKQLANNAFRAFIADRNIYRLENALRPLFDIWWRCGLRSSNDEGYAAVCASLKKARMSLGIPEGVTIG